MALLIVALVVSFVPSILLFLFLRNNHPEDETYRKDCRDLFFKGFLISVIVFLLDFVLVMLWNLIGMKGKSPVIDELFKCFVINATVEEVSKFLVANRYIRKDLSKTSRLDIISYCVIAAIAFGLMEDIIYVFSTNIGQIIVRGVLMGHVPYGMIMGYFYGRAIAEKKPLFKVLAFLIPILLHGSYNFSLNYEADWAAFFAVTEVGLELIYMIYMIFFIRKKRKDPEYTRPVFTEEAI